MDGGDGGDDDGERERENGTVVSLNEIRASHNTMNLRCPVFSGRRFNLNYVPAHTYRLCDNFEIVNLCVRLAVRRATHRRVMLNI